MIYECDQCSKPLPPGVTACPSCGELFEDVVPADAEVPKPGFSAAPARPFSPPPQQKPHSGAYDWLDAPPQTGQAVRRSPNIGLIVVAWILICGCFAGGWIALSSHASSSDASSTSEDRSSSDNSTLLAIGDEGIITYGDSTDVIVAVTEADQNDLTSAVAATDKVGYAQIANSPDRAYHIASGTKAKMIGYGSGLAGAGIYHIRIEGGPHDTQDGWIPQEWLKKQ